MSEHASDRPVVEIHGVYRTFEKETAPVRALRGANLRVARGEFVAIMGPSGCGKSTLLNLIAGLDLADDGEITLAGELITGRSEDWLARMRRRHIGIVFQFFNLLEGMTALENVVLSAMIAGTRRRPAESRARDLLDLLGVGDKADELPAVLSGGQRQRLALARALLADSDVLVLVEPTSAVDAHTEVLVADRLRAARHGDDRLDPPTTVVTTASPLVMDRCDEVAFLVAGRVVATGRHRDLLADHPGYRETVIRGAE
jgi:putative ABC transport system ATP-binding protein